MGENNNYPNSGMVILKDMAVDDEDNIYQVGWFLILIQILKILDLIIQYLVMGSLMLTSLNMIRMEI